MLRRFLDWARKRSEKQDGEKSEPTPRRRFRPLKRIKDMVLKLWSNVNDILPSWIAGFVLQGALILLGAPWWVWPVIALAAWAMFGGFF